MSLYIKTPNGIVKAGRAHLLTKVVDGVPVHSINPKSLKPGCSVATDADLKASADANVAGDKARAADAKAALDLTKIANDLNRVAASLTAPSKKGA